MNKKLYLASLITTIILGSSNFLRTQSKTETISKDFNPVLIELLDEANLSKIKQLEIQIKDLRTEKSKLQENVDQLEKEIKNLIQPIIQKYISREEKNNYIDDIVRRRLRTLDEEREFLEKKISLRYNEVEIKKMLEFNSEYDSLINYLRKVQKEIPKEKTQTGANRISREIYSIPDENLAQLQQQIKRRLHKDKTFLKLIGCSEKTISNSILQLDFKIEKYGLDWSKFKFEDETGQSINRILGRLINNLKHSHIRILGLYYENIDN